jgi:hypothetical protein
MMSQSPVDVFQEKLFIILYRLQHILGFHPHDIDDAEGAGEQYAENPGKIPHDDFPR